MLALLVVYMVVSVRWARQHPTPVEGHEQAAKAPGTKLGGFILIGLAFVLLSSRVLIASVTELAEAHWHIPKVVVAATLVAFGTSLPELVIGVASILKGHTELLVGNVIGADICEVAPCYDPTGVTSVTAANMMFEMLCVIARAVTDCR